MNGDLNEAIDQVANHLGVTVNQLRPYFDSYAKMQALTQWANMLTAIGVAIVLLCPIIWAVIACVKSGGVGDVAMVIFLFAGVGFVITCCAAASFAIAWQQWVLYPDGKLVEMVLGELE